MNTARPTRLVKAKYFWPVVAVTTPEITVSTEPAARYQNHAWCRNAKNRWCHGGNGSIAVSASHFPVQACVPHGCVGHQPRWQAPEREAPRRMFLNSLCWLVVVSSHRIAREHGTILERLRHVRFWNAGQRAQPCRRHAVADQHCERPLPSRTAIRCASVSEGRPSGPAVGYGQWSVWQTRWPRRR